MDRQKKRQIEILAPAGSYEGMKAAMNAGCDAVYIGGSSFGARAYANNLDEDTLLRAIDEAHIRDKKLYLTVNTLLKEQERTGELFRFLESFYSQGLDAVIVQDVGVLHFIHHNFPGLPIHASTQMTLTMAQGADFIKEYGVTRLVTSRELSLEEIRRIRDNTDLEIETFVHGALCYCYSGQCLMSSIIGGRSGNRGRCAQPCRMPYQFHSGDQKLSMDQEKYLLSPKDINTVRLIPDLVEAGIDSFKIEGRMKRPEYGAAVSYLYRKYVDLYFELGKEKYEKYIKSSEFSKDMILLQDIYNRGGFSEGYGKTYNGKKMMSLSRPNHSGVLVGEVVGINQSQVSISLRESVHGQDVLEIRHREEDGYEFTVKDPHAQGEVLKTNVGRRQDSYKQAGKSGDRKSQRGQLPDMAVGDPVYRTKNNELLEAIAKEYMDTDRKLGITGLLLAKAGEKLSLTVTYKDYKATAYGDVVPVALKQPMTMEKLRAPILKTGDTLYYFEDLQTEAEENIFVPVAWLNEIRREAIHRLEEAVTGSYRRHKVGVTSSDRLDPPAKAGAKTFGICVSVQTEDQFEAAMHFPEIAAIYADYDKLGVTTLGPMASEAKLRNKDFYLTLPHICRFEVYEWLKKDISEIIENEAVTGFIIKNFEEAALLQSLFKDGKPKKDILLNYNMYTYNREAKEFWKEKGISRFTAPVELNYQELKTLGIQDCDMLVYGYLPLMVSTQCLFGSTKGCRKNEKNHTGYLTDRLGKNFIVQTDCASCYNTIFNGQPLALHKQAEEIKILSPGNIRMDFTIETGVDTKKILSLFIDTYAYGKQSGEELSGYTTGHFKRGVE